MNREPITHLLRMQIPGKQERRSVYFKKLIGDFLSGKIRAQYSMSGLTAILVAEAALQEGKSVCLRINPQYGAIVSIITEEEFRGE